MRVIVAAASLLLVPFVPSICAAGAVDDVVAVAVKHGGGPLTPRTLSIVSLAMFDAANAVERRYQPYLATASPPPGIDAEQAAIGAGCAALVAVRPTQEDVIRKDCYAIGAGAPDSAGSRRFGEAIGRAHAEARRNDGIGAANSYRPYAAPGVYVPTVLPVGFDTSTAKPFALQSPSQFRPGPPPALTSERWTRDYNEVKTLGGRDSAQRTVEQTATARFFESNGPQQFIDSLASIPVATQQGTADRTRYYALAYITIFDAGIATFDAKYTYNFWRPVTAIRNGDLDNNDATARDATWVPLIDTPMHPEYPCAHCLGSAAFGTVLFSFIGDGRPMPLRSGTLSGLPPSTREFRSARDLAAMASDARVWSGVHYRTSTDVGVSMGTAIGEYILATQLRPLQR